MLTSTIIKVLIVLTSHSQLGDTGKSTGYWLSEVSHAYFAFKDAQFEVQFVSPEGGQPPLDPSSLDLPDSINTAFLENTEIQKTLGQTLTPNQVQPSDYNAIYFAGGHGAMWDFPNNSQLAHLAETIYFNGGIVSSVCHGAAAFRGLSDPDGNPLIRDKRISGFSNVEEIAIQLNSIVPFSLEDGLKAEGGNYQRGEPWKSFVVQDQRIVSGQNPASSSAVAQQVVELIKELP